MMIMIQLSHIDSEIGSLRFFELGGNDTYASKDNTSKSLKPFESSITSLLNPPNIIE